MKADKSPSNFEEWVTTEGGVEHPTHLATLLKPEQQARIAWLRKHCEGMTGILELGCNWGFILNELNGKCGVDINVENIDKAMREFPQRSFLCADITQQLPFEDSQYPIVMLPDVLEHIAWEKVPAVLKEALRIASWKVLITLPYRGTPDCAGCFKHTWIPTDSHVGSLITAIHRPCLVENDGNFVYMEIRK